MEKEVQKITHQLQEQASALVQVHEQQLENLKVDVNKSQEENKSLKQERDNIKTEIEKLRMHNNKTITSLEEQFLEEKEFLVSQHKKELNKNFEELTGKIKHQKLSLEKENQIQLNEKSKEIQDSLDKIQNIRNELARRNDKTEEMKQKFETERLQFQNESKNLNSEIVKLKGEMVAQNTQSDQLKKEFEAKKNIFSDEIKKLNLQATEYQTSIRTLEEKLSASKDENNCSKDRISELSDDLEAAKQQLEPFLTQEKIKQKQIDDQNALALAVEERNQEKVSSILNNSEIDINLRMTFEAKKIEGPVLVLAIQNRDFEMSKMLIQDFGANVNQEIAVENKPTCFVIFGMCVCFER